MAETWGTWGIALMVLGCPVILGFLLVVLSVLEDSLSESVAPSLSDSSNEQRANRQRATASRSGIRSDSEPTPRSAPRPVDAAPVAEGAHL